MTQRARAVLLLAAACSGEPSPAPEAAASRATPGAWTAAERATLASMRLTETLPPDATNARADDPGAAALGRALFYDASLSGDGRFSCASCHDPQKHFTDALPVAVAAGTAARHTPAVEGTQAGPWFFWDGRADSLWAQAAGPLENPVEMASDRVHVARAVLSRHLDAYVAVFGSDVPDLADPRFPPHARPDGDASSSLAVAWTSLSEGDRDAVTQVFVNSVKAIAAFERTVLPGEAPFDRYVDAVLAGDATGGGHLDASAVRGLSFFLREGACVACHRGPFLTDGAFHNLGTAEPRGGFDPGRAVGAVEVKAHEFNCESRWSDADDCPELRFLNPTFDDFPAAFKTPPLRNVEHTAPYMHHGAFGTLEEVLDFYSELPTAPLVGHRELTLRPLGLLVQDKMDLVAFLRSLSAPVRPAALPP